MPVATKVDLEALARGRAINTHNAITAALCGAVPAAICAWQQPPSAAMWIIGLIGGFLWANGFEYALHRWPLHWPGTWTGDGHMLHHASLGQPNEPLYVNLAGRPLLVIAMFLLNIWPFALADYLLHLNLTPGVLISFVLYFILTEEIHWRFHMGGWLPRALDAARARHMRHHDIPTTDFAIFLPLFDRLLGTGSARPVRN
ncbi:MAG: sterol desaturase family protein [Acidobacteriia bacterium]|nr:sterol desaturase family protein [Terriglobia bacterium]